MEAEGRTGEPEGGRKGEEKGGGRIQQLSLTLRTAPAVTASPPAAVGLEPHSS